MNDYPDIEDYIMGHTPTLSKCETWEELDSFTYALLELITPEHLEVC